MSSSIYLLIIIIILCIILIIIYYNKYLIDKKETPFNAQKIFGETLFPNNQYNEKEHYLMKADDNNPSNNYFEKYSNI